VTRRLLTAAVLVMAVSACSSGNGGLSETDGKKIANNTRRSVAETYWRLYRSIGDAALTGSADGWFERCDRNEQKLVRYTVVTVLDSRDRTGKRETEEELYSAVASRFASVGWHMSQGLHRSAMKKGITAELSPPPFSGNAATVLFQVRGKCVDIGAATDTLLNDHGQRTDIYGNSKKGEGAIPTALP
jgi:hypothetical protein